MIKNVMRELRQGTHPLLNESQLKCFEDISSVIEDEYYEPARKEIKDLDEEGAVSVAEHVSKIEEVAKNIITNLEESGTARNRFYAIYPKWKKTREESIQKLSKLAESVNSDTEKCNWLKLAGYCTSFIGGGMTLASISVDLPKPLVVTGGVLTAIGVVGIIGISVVEYKSLRDCIMQAKKIVEKDKGYLEDMRDWLKMANELETALYQVLQINLERDILESIKILVEEALNISNHIERISLIKTQLKEIIEKLPLRQQTSIRIILVSTIIQMFTLVCLLNIDNRFVFDYAALTIRSFVGIFSFLEDAIDVSRLSEVFGYSVVPKRLENSAEGTITVMRCALAAFGMALDFVGMIVTSKDIYSGSTNPFAAKMFDAVEEMRKEAEVLAKVHGNQIDE